MWGDGLSSRSEYFRRRGIEAQERPDHATKPEIKLALSDVLAFMGFIVHFSIIPRRPSDLIPQCKAEGFATVKFVDVLLHPKVVLCGGYALPPSFSGGARPCDIDGPGQEEAIAGRPTHDHRMNSPSSGRIQPTNPL
jgi:hypothetical protein